MARTRLGNLKGPKGDRGEPGPQGPVGPAGTGVNVEMVKKIKDLLLDNNVFVKSDSLEGLMFEWFSAQRNSKSVVLSQTIGEPYVEVGTGTVTIYYNNTLPIQIDNGEIQYIQGSNIVVNVPSRSKAITIKFYNARMKLMFTKTVETR